MIIVSVIGLKKSGKTTCVEALVREFKARGLKVGTVKSMVHSSFTIDTQGKDTWRHRKAGADFVISVSGKELAYLENREGRATLDELRQFVPEDTEILVCEGFEDDNPQILKIITAQSPEALPETYEVRGVSNRVIALSGIMANETADNERYPVFNCMQTEGVRKLADLIVGKP